MILFFMGILVGSIGMAFAYHFQILKPLYSELLKVRGELEKALKGAEAGVAKVKSKL